MAKIVPFCFEKKCGVRLLASQEIQAVQGSSPWNSRPILCENAQSWAFLSDGPFDYCAGEVRQRMAANFNCNFIRIGLLIATTTNRVASAIYSRVSFGLRYEER
jgi:hypothetical protein